MRYCKTCDMEFETVEKFNQHVETQGHIAIARMALGFPTAGKRSKSSNYTYHRPNKRQFNGGAIQDNVPGRMPFEKGSPSQRDVHEKGELDQLPKPSGPAAINTRLISVRKYESPRPKQFESCSTSERADLVKEVFHRIHNNLIPAKELENAKKWLMVENLNLPPELRIQLHSNKTHGFTNVSPSSTSQSNVISKSTENLLIKSENSKNDPFINPADYIFSSEEVKVKQEEVKLEPIEESIKTENNV